MRWLVFVAVLMLAACGRQSPVPVVIGSGGGQTSAEAPPLPAAKPTLRTALGAGGTVTVEAGDSLYAIARRRGVSVRGLIDLNGLTPPYELRVGQTLRLPVEVVHDVVKGDTLSSIAQRYGVSLRDLARANDLKDPYVIKVSQRLLIPTGATGSGGGEGAVQAIAAQPVEPIRAQPVSSRTDTVVITSAGTSIEPAEPIVVTTVEDAPEPVPPAPPPEPVAPAEPAEVVPPEPLPEPEPAPQATAAIAPEPAPRAGKLFAWPVQGKVVSTFGAKEGGLSNDGINIASPRGTPVVAAENGVVVYAGNEIPGFGNLILIRHADGWVTAYAHNDTLAVTKNDRVDRGQPIATVGATGNVASPQSHFEIRKGNEPVDPLKFLARN